LSAILAPPIICGTLSSCSAIFLAAFLTTALNFFLSFRSSNRLISCTRSILLCQISSGDSLANAPMRRRYAATVVAAAARARFVENPEPSAATATLDASRFRSTVKSTPGNVSSKSLISK
jgi:hypothetical protein